MALDQIRNSRCRECELFLNAGTVCLMGYGNTRARLMLVGEAPGEEEDNIGRPFVGRAGKLLTDILSQFDIKRQDIYISNAVKCRPPANRTPHLDEMKACRHYLLDEIKVIQPKIIVGLGVAAMKTLLKRKDFALGGNRGAIFGLPEDSSISVIGTYHPAAISRNPNWLPAVVEDFDRIVGYLNEGIPKLSSAKYKRGIAPVGNEVVVDVETVSLSDLKLLCVGTSVEDKTGFCTDEITPELKAILADPKITKIGHNFKFDYKALKAAGLEVNGTWRDTMIEAHLLDENRLGYGLKELALQYANMGRYAEKVEQFLKLSKGNMESVPKGAREVYCVKDCDATHRLDSLFFPKLEEQGLLPLFSLTMQGARVMADAEIAGVQIDLDRRLYLEKVYRKKIGNSLFLVKKIAGDAGFNPQSPTQLGRLLVGKMGFPILGRTLHKKIKVDKHILAKYLKQDKSGIIQAIIDLRKASKMYSMYLDPDRTLVDSGGLIHANFRINGTDTGRYSCTNPNLQQVEKKSQIKSMFISKFTGGSLIQFDCDQGELRMLAQYSKDELLVETFKKGIDIHARTASSIFGIDIKKITPEQRATGKLANFAILYGVGDAHLGQQIGVSASRAAKYIENYFSKHEGVRRYIKDKHREIVSEGEVCSLFGRKRRILIANTSNFWEVSDAQRKAANAPIQSALHELNVLGMVALTRWFKDKKMKAHIIMEVHDAIIVDCPKEEVKRVMKYGKKILDNPNTDAFGFSFDIPITYSVSVGRTWKEAAG